MKQHAPAAARNMGPIGDVLARELPPSGLVLEIASGTGEHAVTYARRFPALQWQPTDADPAALPSIAAWRDEAGAANLLAPLLLDASSPEWPVAGCDAIVAINVVHISEWAATIGLFTGGQKLLPAGAPLILYGPYLEDDVQTAPSNTDFDRWLKGRDPEWGLRNLAEVDRVAAGFGFRRKRRVEMPANNLTLVYRKD